MTEATRQAATTIRTPDQRLRVFVSSTLQELADERQAVRRAVSNLRLSPVLFELGARPHPARELYRAYLEQSHIFIGVYWQRYGWVAPGMDVSGLEDEYRLSGERPKLIYVKTPALEREEGLKRLLGAIKEDDSVSYKSFSTADELQELVENDLALLLTERFERLDGVTSFDYADLSEPVDSLPRPTTPLVGRQEEIERVSELLRREEVRLITLCGPGGIGKTRLSIAIAERMRPDFSDGVHFVPLAPIRDPANVPGAVVQALGLTISVGSQPLEYLKGYLRDRNALLVLDNFEQITEAAPYVAELLSAAPRLKVLATSRAVLKLSFEYEHVVPPLELPTSRSSHAESVPVSEAVALFAGRARAVLPSFELHEQNQDAVSEICRRLDGLPLAIELAAARIKFLTPKALLKRLDRRLEVLTGGERDRPDRQQTLRNTIDWSFQLLSPEEQLVFTRLGLFVGGFDLEAAEYMNADIAGVDVVEVLFSLADKSLLTHQLGEDEPRFFLLETVREFANEKLEVMDDVEALRDRHAGYYVRLCDRAGVELVGHGQPRWCDLLERELPNLRTTMRHLLAKGNRDAIAMGWNLWRYWWIRGHQNEGRRWMEQALQSQSALTLAERAKGCFVAGAMAVVQADYEQARMHAQGCVDLSREAGEPYTEGLGLLGLGLVALYRGDFEIAREHLDAGLAIFRKLGDWWGQGHLLHYLWRLAAVEGRAVEELGKLEESASLFRANGDSSALVLILHNLALASLGTGDHDRTAQLLEEALQYARDLRNKWYVAYCVEGFACLAADRDHHEDAAHLFGFAEFIREQVHAPLAPADSIFYAPFLARIRDAMPVGDLEVAWRDGRRWTFEVAQERMEAIHSAVAASATD